MRRLHVVSILFIATVAVGCANKQRTFASPDEAVDGFVNALRANDDKALLGVLGAGAEDIVSSGDDIADQQRREKFLTAYDQQHRLQSESSGDMTLLVGADDWPLPIPIVQDQRAGAWRFDTEAGRDEVLSRRIGQNELDVIQVCQAIVDAQMDYASEDRDGDGVHEYADKFLSDANHQNGLYWPTDEGEAPSPLGPLVADAAEYNYAVSQRPTGEPRPFHGYCFRMLQSQGASAPGGARDYVIDGNMIGGFAVVAHPAEYGSSGIMTMIVNQDGVVYQKDLGPDSAKIAREMQSFDPTPGWEAVPAEELTSTIVPAR
jgi:hypothetical protein